MQLREGLEELEATRGEPVQVVGPADQPLRADHANAEVPITSGAMLGLLAGWLLALGRDRARHSNGRPRDGRTVAIRSKDGHHAR
jgi:hypothetical protein